VSAAHCARCAALEAERDALAAALMGAREERVELAMAFELEPKQAVVLGILLRRAVVPRESLYEALYGAELQPRGMTSVTAHVSFLRSALAQHGIELPRRKGNRAYRAAYELPPSEKAKVRTALAAWRAAHGAAAP
jgi:DNA-binding response OmpR family regulator